MNENKLDRSTTPWSGYLGFGYLALAALAVFLSPVNVHIVIAQDGTEIVVQAADPGEPPTPTIVAKQDQSTAASSPSAEVANESSVETSSEVSSEAEVSALAETANVASEAELLKLLKNNHKHRSRCGRFLSSQALSPSCQPIVQLGLEPHRILLQLSITFTWAVCRQQTRAKPTRRSTNRCWRLFATISIKRL